MRHKPASTKPTIAQILPAFVLLKDDSVYNSGFCSYVFLTFFAIIRAIADKIPPNNIPMNPNAPSIAQQHKGIAIELIPKTKIVVEFGKAS